MIATGKLEDFPVTKLLQAFSKSQESGKLTLSRRDGHGVVLLRQGRIVYAASNSVRETLGNALVCRKVISEETLTKALEAQHESSEERRLGAILVEMGAVDQKILENVLRSQVQKVLQECSRWPSGFFKFESLEIPYLGEMGVEAHDLILDEGLSAERLADSLSTATAKSVPSASPLVPSDGGQEDAPEPAMASLKSIMSEIRTPAFTAEVTLQIMRYASEVVNRGVLFVRQQDVVRGMGQFGIEVESADARVRQIEMPVDQPSVLAEAVERKETYRGKLADTPWNQHLIGELGGQEPQEAVAVPMLVSGSVVLILYGDNLPLNQPIGCVDGLEVVMLQAGLAMEKAMLESRLRQVDERLSTAGP
jgi:hypothetical protein